MFLIAILVAVAALASGRLLRAVLPFESLLAVGVVTIICAGLFQIGRLS